MRPTKAYRAGLTRAIMAWAAFSFQQSYTFLPQLSIFQCLGQALAYWPQALALSRKRRALDKPRWNVYTDFEPN